MNDLISIIVPIYKVDRYLRRCIDSIINQSYTNLEIILVNDGSPDSSGAICDDYAKKDKRIKVVHQENKGLSGARNAGLEIAQGKYIGLVDSDDYIHPRMYEWLYNSLKESGTEISICGFKYVHTGNYDCESIGKVTAKLISTEELINNMYKPDGMKTIVAWNKLYSKKIFENYRYPLGKKHEDEFAVHHIMGKVSAAAQIEECLYYYYQRSDSIVGQGYPIKTLDRIFAYEDRLQYYKSKNLRHPYIQAYTHYMCHLIRTYGGIKKHRPEDIENIKILREKIINGYNEFNLLIIESLKSKMKLYHKYRRIIKVNSYILFLRFIERYGFSNVLKGIRIHE